MKINLYSQLGLSLLSALSGCGSHSAQNQSPVPVVQKKTEKSISLTDGITMEKLDSPPLPVDLAAHPSFVTQGFVIARERYKNWNDHPVKLLPSESNEAIILQSQFRSALAGSSGSAAGLTATSLALSVTTPQTPFDIEQVSNSVLEHSVVVAPGQEVVFNWRVSPAAGLPLCDQHLGKNMWNHTEIDFSAEGASISGSFQRKVSFSDDSNQAQGDLFSEAFPAGQSVGTMTNPVSNPTNCIWIDFIHSAPEDYDLGLKV